MYVDIQEEIERKLASADTLYIQLKKMQAQRLRISFDMDDKAEHKLQTKIFDNTRQITNLLKQSEKELKGLRESSSDN